MANLVQFGSFTEDDVEKERESLGKSVILRPKAEGSTHVRLLPPYPDGKLGHIVAIHWVEIIENGKPRKVMFVCPLEQSKREKLPPQFCQSCDRRDALLDEGNEEGAREFEPRDTVYLRALDREKRAVEPQIMQVTPPIYKGMLDLIKPPNEEKRRVTKPKFDLTHPIKGHDIDIFREKGPGRQWKQEVNAFPDPSPLAVDKDGNPDIEEINRMLSYRLDMRGLSRIPHFDQIDKIWSLVPGVSGARREIDGTPRHELGARVERSLPPPTGRANRNRKDIIDAAIPESDEDEVVVVDSSEDDL